MRANEIKVGEVYIAKVSGKLTHLKVDSIDKKAVIGYRGRQLGTGANMVKHGTRYHCTNLRTGRQILVRSAAKFRLPATPPKAKAVVCTCGADRSGPSAEAHKPDCPQAIYDHNKGFQAGGNESDYN